MKILTAEQIRDADRFTIENEPIPSIDLMERAARAVFQWIISNFDPRKSIAVICGTGNNGGDGLAVARMLHEHGYPVSVFIINGGEGGSDDFNANRQKLPLSAEDLSKDSQIPDFGKYHLLIDAIFGTGLTRPVEGFHEEVIERMNNSGTDILSIDMPSGIFSDASSKHTASVRASVTLTFQVPKLALLMPENGEAVGEWHIIDIQLNRDFINSRESPYRLITDTIAASGLKNRSKFAHKGDFGRAVLMTGSLGKMGAGILSARGALRSGLGLLTAYIPGCGYSAMQTAVPEAMVEVDDGDTCLTGIPELESVNALGIGPGIGMAQQTVYAMEEILRKFKKPLVIDADGLNLLAEHVHLQELIPENSILTPHPGEFARLAGEWKDDFERLEMQVQMAKKMDVIIVLKGAHTSVALPDGSVYFNVSGNPGMATGGSGDVLTGVLTALLSQNFEPSQAALTGIYIHGLAGDLAARSKSQIGMVAGDIADHLPEAWSVLEP